ncbi:MAG: hypothetical protein A2289_15420 [Deltaproteobacteria bacterium RIFOXYA12_FULL_58_15]|nr:MAG: hypothetical protein A2289_15420 [Deltaproteobacteria bacterium RIFOXYA12_FULL_58_15]
MSNETSEGQVQVQDMPIIAEDDRVMATVKELGEQTAQVELEGGFTGIIRREETVKANEQWPFDVGDQFTVWVDQKMPQDQFVVSKIKADKLSLWDEIADAAEHGDPIEGEIIAAVRGGLSVDIGLRAFLPSSQLELRPVDDLGEYIGKRMPFVITKFNPQRGNAVVSRRPLLEQERQDRMQETLSRLAEGDVLVGQVVSMMSYGAFVDVGGVDGLLHIEQMSWARLKHPSEVVAIGDELEVMVLEIDRDTQKIALGTKQLTEDPWDKAVESYPESTKTTGTVVGIAKYGAFVEIAPGVEGLIHVSEMSWTERVNHPKTVVQQGQKVEVVVLGIDNDKRRLSLSLRQVQPNPWTEWSKKYSKGTIVEGKVRSVTDFGVFVGVEEGLDGLVHNSEMSWDRIKDPSAAFAVGDDIKAVVIDLRVEEQRLGLSIKQLTEDPWVTLTKTMPVGTKVKGKVARLVDFGAFIEIAEGIDGLCHASEIREERVEKPSDVLKVGEEVEVVIIEMDANKHKVGLSIKALNDDFEDDETIIVEQKPFTNSFGSVLSKSLGTSVDDEKADS